MSLIALRWIGDTLRKAYALAVRAPSLTPAAAAEALAEESLKTNNHREV
jgi:hypothetical protein